MGLFDAGGGSPQKVNLWNKRQREVFRSLAPVITEGMQRPAPTAPIMYTPRTPEEEQFFNLARSKAVEQMARGEVPYEVGPEYAKRYFESAIRPIYEREWRETILPSIQEQYAGSTFASTGRDAAVEKAARDYGLELAAKQAELVYGEELARRQAIEAAMSRVPAGQQLAASAGQYSRQIEDQRAMDAVQRFLMGESVDGQYSAAYNPMVALAFNLLGLTPFGVATSQQGPGLGYGVVSGMAQGLGTAVGRKLFS